MIREIIAATACLAAPPQERMMSTAAMVMQHGYVMDVADHKVKAIRGQFQRFRVEQVWSKVMSVMAGALAVSALNRVALRFEEDVIFFKGIDHQMQENSPNVDEWADRILPRLEKIKTSLLDGRKSIMESITSRDVKILKAKERVIASMSDLFEAIEQFKWTIKELRADASPVAEGYVACSPEELSALFNRMSQEG